MAVGTTTTTASALKQYWHDFFIERLVDTLAMKGLTKRARIPMGNGKTVFWVGINKTSPAGATLTEGADPTARSSQAFRVSASLAEYGNLIKNSRLFMDTAIDGTREQIISDLARDAAKTVDDAVLAVALANGTVLFAGAASHRSNIVSASTATIKDVRKAVRLLQISSVPRFPDGYYVGLVHPDVAFDLQTDSAWLDVNRYRDSVKYDIVGEVGRLYGVRFALAPTIPILTNSGSAAVDVYRSLVFGPDFIGQSDLGDLEVVINEPGKTSELGQFNTYGYRFVMASAALQNARGVRLESSATLGNDA
jgi:N4-gp56 family major capsid protein